ncbi:MAG: hypothetical protein KA190_23205 [Kofleriaceae bacterium]|nr:hypothetical protein [Kofleriaceae bacterium]
MRERLVGGWLRRLAVVGVLVAAARPGAGLAAPAPCTMQVTDLVACGKDTVACSVPGAMCAAETVFDAGRCGAALVIDGGLCGSATVTDGERCGLELITDAAKCGREMITDGAKCGYSYITDLAEKVAQCAHCVADPANCTCRGPAKRCAMGSAKRCAKGPPKSCSIARSCCQLAPASCAQASACWKPRTCDRVIPSLESLGNLFGTDGALSSGARCELGRTVAGAYKKQFATMGKTTKAAVLAPATLAEARAQLEAAAKVVAQARRTVVAARTRSLRAVLANPTDAALLSAVVVKIARKEFDRVLLRLVRELAPKLGLPAPERLVVPGGPTIQAVETGVAGPAGSGTAPPRRPWPQAWGLSLVGDLGLGLGVQSSIGFAVDNGLSMIVGLASLSLQSGFLFGAGLNLMIDLYPEQAEEVPGWGLGFSLGAAYGLGVGTAVTWSVCRAMDPACKGARLDKPVINAVKILPEPTLSIGIAVGFDVNATISAGYQVPLGVAK